MFKSTLIICAQAVRYHLVKETNVNLNQGFDTTNSWTEVVGNIEYKRKGKVYTDRLCLLKDLCVSHFPYLYKQQDKQIAGVVGISPEKTEHNYVLRLKQSGSIDKALVSINYAKWRVLNVGNVDYDHIVDGKNGTFEYLNHGGSLWGLNIDGFLYKDQEMSDGEKTMVAVLDNTDDDIHLPKEVFNNTLNLMQKNKKEGLEFKRSQ